MNDDRAPRLGGWVPPPSRLTWWQSLWKPFWALPLAIVLGSIALGVLLPLLDSQVWPWVPILFHGGPSGARNLLGTIASAMISVTGLVFSITMVVLQLASSQFTPRVLGSFLDSRITQVTLGVFTGTFIYALTVQRAVRDETESGTSDFVPQLATSHAYVLVLFSVALFLAFIHHITTSIQVAHVIRATERRTLGLIDQLMPEDQGEHAHAGEGPRSLPELPDSPVPIVQQGDGGRVTGIELRRIVALAEDAVACVVLTAQIGDYVPSGGVIGTVRGSHDEASPTDRGGDPEASGGKGSEELEVQELAERVERLVRTSATRTMSQDIGFGIRQLVDIADRALSPGINDPTTAVQVIDALHSILRTLVARPDLSGVVTDDSGRVRLAYRPQSVEQLLGAAVEEISVWGRSSVQVPPRLEAMLEDLAMIARPEHRAPIMAMLDLVRERREDV